MTSSTDYTHALCQLKQINFLKQALATLMQQHCTQSQLLLPISPAARHHAIDCIHEVVDDMYYKHAADARLIQETWERENRAQAIRELSTLKF